MTNQVVVTNTLAFLFPVGAPQPTLDEVAAFVRTLVVEISDLETAYKISEERSVFLKLKCENALKRAVKQNPSRHTFQYSSGKVVEVNMSVAGGNIRYVRVFDLPPEVSDLDISLVLEKYGKIQRVEREKFPAHLGLGNLATGIRGVHMDIEKDIPPILRFVGRKGRVYYDGMTPRCYLCLSEGHLKAACRNKKVQRSESEEAQKSSKNTYAGVVGGSTASPETGKIEILEQQKEAEEEITEAECDSNGKQSNSTPNDESDKHDLLQSGNNRHHQTIEMKRQHSIDSDSTGNKTKKANVNDDSDGSQISVGSSDICPYTMRPYAMPDLSHIEDPVERQAIIEDNKRRIDAAYRELEKEKQKKKKSAHK